MLQQGNLRNMHPQPLPNLGALPEQITRQAVLSCSAQQQVRATAINNQIGTISMDIANKAIDVYETNDQERRNARQEIADDIQVTIRRSLKELPNSTNTHFPRSISNYDLKYANAIATTLRHGKGSSWYKGVVSEDGIKNKVASFFINPFYPGKSYFFKPSAIDARERDRGEQLIKGAITTVRNQYNT